MCGISRWRIGYEPTVLTSFICAEADVAYILINFNAEIVCVVLMAERMMKRHNTQTHVQVHDRARIKCSTADAVMYVRRCGTIKSDE